jgi:hypothetical protein
MYVCMYICVCCDGMVRDVPCRARHSYSDEASMYASVCMYVCMLCFHGAGGALQSAPQLLCASKLYIRVHVCVCMYAYPHIHNQEKEALEKEAALTFCAEGGGYVPFSSKLYIRV